MSETRDPYSPPQAAIQTGLQARPARPRIVVILVCLYLAVFPIFAWRVSLGGKLQVVALVFWLTLFFLYALGIAFALLRGKRWARALVLGFAALSVCYLFASLLLSVLQPGGAWELRSGIFVLEATMKAAVAALLLLPETRKWFSDVRTSAHRG